MTKNHKHFMKIALSLAKKGGCLVHPNPMVGCVIVKNNKVIGRGWHQYFGGPHAEINALKDAGLKARGADLYVTLEPCNHYGKTPPCTEAIIKAGIKKVIIAMIDPNRNTSGQGVKRLKANGIKVVTGVLKDQAIRLNQPYCKSVKSKKLHVTLKMAMSLDGKIAARTGDSRWISCEGSRKLVHSLRAKNDAILTGINTVLKDNPRLTAHGAGKDPVRIILDPGLRTPRNANVLDGKTASLFIYNMDKIKVIPDHFQNRNNIVLVPMKPVSKTGRFDFQKVVEKLKNIGIMSLLIEGGGETAAEALEAGVVDDVVFFIAPKIVGGRTALTPVEGIGAALVKNAIHIYNMKTSRIGQDIVIRGSLR